MKALANGAAEIFVFDEIGYWGVTAKEFARDLKEVNPNDSIELHINSPGGSVTDGIAIFNLLKNHKSKVNVHIDGLAASMASVIAMAGDTITMPENALMMIHNPWGGAMGDADELRKTADVLDKMKQALISAYVNKTGKDTEEISQLMDAETWMTGSEAVEMGFASQVTDEVQLAASFDASKLNNFKNDKTSLFKSSAKAGTTGEVIMTTKVKAADNADPNIVTEPVASNVNVEAVAAKAVADFQAKETARKQGIRTAFGSFSSAHGDLLSTCLEDGECTVDKAQAQLLAKLGEKTEPQGGGFTAAFSHSGNGAIVKESMVAAVKSRAGIKLEDGELTKDNPFKMMTLSEMARASLEHKGVGVGSYGDRMALVGAAFTHSSSDFGSVLADVANKAMLKGYESADETFQQWTSTGTLSDFKINNRVGLNTFPSLRKVQPGAEYKHATMGDRGEQIMLATYGELFSINRQAIINDDLSAFTRIPSAMGRAAIRTVGDLVYAILVDNPSMSDEVALFHATHGNYVAGASSALSVASVSAGRKAMKLQKDATGNTLNIRPEFLLTPVGLELEADTLMSDTVYPGKSNNERNPINGMATVIADPRLDDASDTSWYLTAGQALDTIEVAYLDGNSTPYLDQMDGWNIDGTSFKVRLDAGVAPLDFRTMYKSKGAA